MNKSTGPIGQLNKSNKNVQIIGAGIAGLLMAYYLKKSGYKVTIYEKDSRVGGKIGTKQTSYGPAETAANAIFTNDDVLELMAQLKLEYFKAPHDLKKFVWRDNKPTSPPFKWYELLSFLLKSFRKINKVNIEKKTVLEVFKPMMGEYFTREIMSAALGGIYAQPTSVIHFKSLFKSPITSRTYFGFFRNLLAMRKSSNKSKALSISFKNGMQDLVDSLSNELKENIKYETISEVSCSNNTIICTEASSASKLLDNPLLSKELSSIKYNSMYSSTVITNKKIDYLDHGFGVVFPPEAKFQSLGVLHNTAIFPFRTFNSQDFSYTFMTKKNEKTENISQTISNEISQISTLNSSNIKDITTTVWEQAIPIYDQSRYNAIIKLRRIMSDQQAGLVLFGNYVDGISIREMVSHAKSFAQSNL